MARMIADYYSDNDGATGAIAQARQAVAELPIETIVSDPDGCGRDILNRYRLPLLVFDGEAEPAIADGDGTPSIIVRQRVEPDARIAEVLRRVDEQWVSTPYHLSYQDSHISYKIRAGEPAFVKEEVRHSLEMVQQHEIDPRNRAVTRENEKLKRAINEALDERLNEAKVARDHRQRVKEALGR